jgi:hypothetical protein
MLREQMQLRLYKPELELAEGKFLKNFAICFMVADVVSYVFLNSQMRQELHALVFPGEVLDSAVHLGLHRPGSEPPAILGAFGFGFLILCGGLLWLRRLRPCDSGRHSLALIFLVFLFCRLIPQDLQIYDFNKTAFLLVLFSVALYSSAGDQRLLITSESRLCTNEYYEDDDIRQGE